MTWHPQRRRIFLMRHGAVSYFTADGQPVRPDTVPLTAEGEQQAEAASALLAEIPLDRVLCSDLPRTQATARIVARGRDVKIEERESLREIRAGRLADIPSDHLQQSLVAAFTSGLQRETQFLGGESYGSLWDRVTAAFLEVLGDSSWQRALIVAHGGVNRVLLTLALGSGLPGFGRLEQDPACINVIDVDEAGNLLVRLVNFTPYNAAKIGIERTSMEEVFWEYLQRKGMAG